MPRKYSGQNNFAKEEPSQMTNSIDFHFILNLAKLLTGGHNW